MSYYRQEVCEYPRRTASPEMLFHHQNCKPESQLFSLSLSLFKLNVITIAVDQDYELCLLVFGHCSLYNKEPDAQYLSSNDRVTVLGLWYRNSQ